MSTTREYLEPADLGDLMRFQETIDDCEGYDIGKSAVKRLAELGVLQNHGFGKYSITAFGHFVLEHMFLQNPTLPLMTNGDRDRAAIAKAEAHHITTKPLPEALAHQIATQDKVGAA